MWLRSLHRVRSMFQCVGFMRHSDFLSVFSYWLPQLKAHEFIALRFLPQTEYEAAAPLSISPSPDTTIRVMMLFKGIPNTQAAVEWDSRKPSFIQGPAIWKDRVGPGTNLGDVNDFISAVELGAMEVP
jgi:hypothetical protein